MVWKVLIVEDEPNIVVSLEFLMHQAGYEVAVARTGTEALELLGSFTPHLVLLDIMLPKVNGLDLCQQIRENPDWRQIKVIILSAKGTEGDVRQGLAAGADSYITKPFSTRALLAQIRDFLVTEETGGARETGEAR